ncbi:MAG: response regulator transcription factor [Verrucomicrobia bacterium]|nr:response regulator transcription factor [Verrucomicrobiota bacterium]MBI3870566.1 response regulator transcription factor [Verrucomicrobiota bacterium]
MNTILIIEDDSQTRENLQIILEMEGFQTATAANGRIGLDMARQHPPDLVLCDVSMPELDGYGVLKGLRAHESTNAIPFIFLTARGEKREVRDGMNLGADDYLTKPLDAEDLLAAIQTRLARQRAFQASGATPDFSSAKPLEALSLTPREAEVLLWVAQGKANADVATILGMSEKTVKIHLGHVFEKLCVETRTAAALRAIEVLAGGAA